MQFEFTKRRTLHGCTVILVTPKRRQVVRFRDGLVSGVVSANNWIQQQSKSISDHAKDNELEQPKIIINN
jgi:hypothetical protein